MRVLTHERQLCTYHELQTVYTLEHLFDFEEMLDAYEALKESAEEKALAKAEADRAKQERAKR